jgi:hypothetical protein
VEREELLRPVFAGAERRPTGYKPWRLQSQIYVGFFGGALAVGAIAFANAVMLGMSVRARVAIAAIALAAEVLMLAFVAVNGSGVVRIVHTAAGLLAYGGAFLIQRSADRVYHFHTKDDDPYDSLLVPGIVACLLGILIDSELGSAVAA